VMCRWVMCDGGEKEKKKDEERLNG
jgi:hypothetical protein